MGSAQTKDCDDKFDVMCRADVTHEGREFWRTIFLAGCDLPELHKIMQADSIRHMRLAFPQNLAALIMKCAEQLQHFVTSAKSNRGLAFKSSSTALRILTRIMPILFEPLPYDPNRSTASQPGVDFVHAFFWENKTFNPKVPGEVFTTFAGHQLSKKMGRVLMEVLLEVCMSVGGCANPANQENLPEASKDYPDVLVRHLWYGGIGPAKVEEIVSYSAIDSNRVDVVECLLACASGPLFQPDPLRHDPFIDTFVNTEMRPQVTTLIFSLLNCIAPYDPTGSLPYTSYMTDYKEPLMVGALHLLVVMLDNGHVSESTSVEAKRRLSLDTRGGAVTVHNNAFWSVVGGLTRRDDMEKMYYSTVKLLSNPMRANATWLPGSQKCIENTPEILGLLWKILDVNVAFRKFICTEMKPELLVETLLWHMWQARENRDVTMTMHVALWTFLLLSSEREFATSLNKPFTSPLGLPLPVFNGTYVDLVFIVFQQIVQCGSEWVRASTDGLLTVIANLSPFAKSMCTVTASKMMSLYDGLSNTKFINSAPDNWRCLFLLLQSFCNAIQYQYEGNLTLVYAILRKEERFRQFGQLLEKTTAEKGEVMLNIPEAARADLMMYSKVITVTLDVLYPRVQQFCDAGSGDETDMMAFLANSTLVGLLPPTRGILIRTYFATPEIYSYIATWLWGLIYNRHQSPPMFAPEHVQLFRVILETSDGKLHGTGGAKGNTAYSNNNNNNNNTNNTNNTVHKAAEKHTPNTVAEVDPPLPPPAERPVVVPPRAPPASAPAPVPVPVPSGRVKTPILAPIQPSHGLPQGAVKGEAASIVAVNVIVPVSSGDAALVHEDPTVQRLMSEIHVCITGI